MIPEYPLPTPQDVQAAFHQHLSSFNPYDVVCSVNINGWSTYPKTLRTRAANEVWFRIWEQSRKNEDNFLKCFGEIFLSDSKKWHVAWMLHELYDRGDYTDPAIIIVKAISIIVEFATLKKISEITVPAWDQTKNALRIDCGIKAQALHREIGDQINLELHKDNFNELYDKLIQNADFLMRRVSKIIIEEEKIRFELRRMLGNIDYERKIKDFYSAISEQTPAALISITALPEALLRPCLELLVDPALDISTGIQYEAAAILGRINDSRAAATILRCLEKYDLKHTNLRCNLIYALGNIPGADMTEAMITILKGPDEICVTTADRSSSYQQSRRWEKCEALWALGKHSIDDATVLPVLREFNRIEDREINIALAWAAAQIGIRQKKECGEIDSTIIEILNNLIQSDDHRVFEEAVYNMRQLELPDLANAARLAGLRTVPIMALKPSHIAFYELSETIIYQGSVKQPVVLAVTGDSGTGKTYFCNAILKGFRDIGEKDILYMMRDNPAHMHVFYRILGIKKLKEFFDPQHYENYPLNESEDDPDAFFDEFIEKHNDKKLIILDGWMDDAYFYQLVKIFYLKGRLDALVNFRTTLSTRRLNLEMREKTLEVVKTCLLCIEKPVLEETEFYRNGDVFIYNLDNSIGARIDAGQIKEVFSRQKIAAWSEFIKIGNFNERRLLQSHEHIFTKTTENIEVKKEKMHASMAQSIKINEDFFDRQLNDDEDPGNLLQTIILPMPINNCLFYTHGQIAVSTADGSVGIMVGFNDRIFYSSIGQKVIEGLAVTRDSFITLNKSEGVHQTSFKKMETRIIAGSEPKITAMTSDRGDIVVTGHDNGLVRVMDLEKEQITSACATREPIVSLFIDYQQTIFIMDHSNRLAVWRVAGNQIEWFDFGALDIIRLAKYPNDRFALITDGDMNWLSIFDIRKNQCFDYDTAIKGKVSAVYAYADGRIFIAALNDIDGKKISSLTTVNPLVSSSFIESIGSQEGLIKNLFAMGPRLLSYGEKGKSSIIKIWGSRFYVKTERDKLRLMPTDRLKPPYYWTIF